MYVVIVYFPLRILRTVQSNPQATCNPSFAIKLQTTRTLAITKEET
uniref:Ash family protein n=1 Tax=Heterorhabditis bacteriophora TaxID=37862 RepID=A0A1I7WZE9_HETBA